MARSKSDGKPARARYKNENHRLKNKISRLRRYCKNHPTDKQTYNRLEELMIQL